MSYYVRTDNGLPPEGFVGNDRCHDEWQGSAATATDAHAAH